MQFYQKNSEMFIRKPFKSLSNNRNLPRNLTEKKLDKIFTTRNSSMVKSEKKKKNKSSLKVKFEKKSRKSIKTTRTSSVKKVVNKKLNFLKKNPNNTYFGFKFNKKQFLTNMKDNSNLKCNSKNINFNKKEKNVNFAPKKIKTSYIIEKKTERTEKKIERRTKSKSKKKKKKKKKK